jgi:hypothetical protein
LVVIVVEVPAVVVVRKELAAEAVEIKVEAAVAAEEKVVVIDLVVAAEVDEEVHLLNLHQPRRSRQMSNKSLKRLSGWKENRLSNPRAVFQFLFPTLPFSKERGVLVQWRLRLQLLLRRHLRRQLNHPEKLLNPSQQIWLLCLQKIFWRSESSLMIPLLLELILQWKSRSKLLCLGLEMFGLQRVLLI